MHHLLRASPLPALSLLLACAEPAATSERQAAKPAVEAPPNAAPNAAPKAAPKIASPMDAVPRAEAGGVDGPTEPVAPATAELLLSLGAGRSARTIRADQLSFEVREDEVWVSDGRRAAPMGLRADSAPSTTVQTAADSSVELVLEYTDVISCDGPSLRRSYPVDVLRARIEGTAAFKRHQAKAYDEAARGFALAAHLDPTPEKRWTNLACALSLGAKVDMAVIALAPLLDHKPLVAYAKVHADPELKALRARPEVTRLRAATPGSARLSLRKGELQGFAFASSTAMARVARIERSDSGGSCQFAVNLSFYSSDDGEESLSLPLVRLGETRVECGLDADGAPASIVPEHVPAVQRRLDHANLLLRELGFATSSELERVVVNGDDEVVLPTSKLKVLLGDKTTIVLRGDRPVTKAPQGGYGRLGAVGYDPLAKVVFLEWGNDLPEGCASELRPAGTQVLPVVGEEPRSP